MGAPQIHGELLKLEIDVGQTTVAKCLAKRRRPQSQGWKTFLRNHADGIASIDMFVITTISFRLRYGLLVVGYSRQELLWLGVATHPNAEWIARQLTEACGWRVNYHAISFVIAMAPMAALSLGASQLWACGTARFQLDRFGKNGLAERLIGSIRRECFDNVVIFGEQHLRHLLNSYQPY